MLRCLLAVVLASLVSPGLRGEEIGPMPREVPTRFEVPYRLTDTKHVLVRVKLNGKGPFNFIIDTGAPALIMSEKVAAKSGAVLENGWGDFRLDLEGGLTVRDAKGLSTEMFQLKGMNALGLAGVELHGVIGYNILARYKIEYDFTTDRLIWTRLKFDPPKMVGLGKEAKGGQGGMEFVGDLMKMMGPLMGIKPNFEVKARGFLGLEVAGDTSLKITVIYPAGPAEQAGLKAGDTILKVNGKEVETIKQLQTSLSKVLEGDEAKVSLRRNREIIELTLKLGKGL